MSGIATYQALCSKVQDFLVRRGDDEVIRQIPTYIQLAEADMNRRVRHWRMQAVADQTATDGILALPGDWLEAVSVHAGAALSFLPVTQLDDLAESTGSDPVYYTVRGSNIEIMPEYSGAVKHTYYQRIPALTATDNTNWMLAYNPDCYLYGALIHSAPHLQEDARIATWSSLYDAAIDRSNSDGRGNSGPMRMRIPNG